MVGSGVRDQAGRDSRLRARCLVPRRQAGCLARQLRGAVRQGAWIHAGGRRGAAGGPVRGLGRCAEKEGDCRRGRSGQVWDVKDLIARGEAVYAANCAACHQATGKGVAPAFPPLDGSKIATGPVAAHLDTVLNGVVKNGQATAMVAWKNTLSPTEIAAVVTYERNAWGNHVGDAVQPSQVMAAGK